MSINTELPPEKLARFQQRLHSFQDSTAIRRLADAGPDGGNLDIGRIIAHADAAVHGGNPGACAVGVYIICPTMPDFRSIIGKNVGIQTSNVGEYLALLTTLEHVKHLGDLNSSLAWEKIKRIDIFMDSKLICSQVAMTWRTFEGHLVPLRNQAIATMHDMVINDGKEVLLRWTHRDNNNAAHRAAQRARTYGDFAFGPTIMRQKRSTPKAKKDPEMGVAS